MVHRNDKEIFNESSMPCYFLIAITVQVLLQSFDDKVHNKTVENDLFLCNRVQERNRYDNSLPNFTMLLARGSK